MNVRRELGRILVVDDDAATRRELVEAVAADGHEAVEVTDGREALDFLQAALDDSDPPNGIAEVDVVLLDLQAAEADGYATLAAIKADEALRHLPVIFVSGSDERATAVRAIEMGATDYLRRPFDREILGARLDASLVGKRLRDLELDYLAQVDRLTDAAAALEAGTFEAGSLDSVAAREDDLGRLARSFARMASEVKAREERLRAEVQELRIEIDEARQARQVAEITGSDYFRDLRARAKELRRVVEE